MTRSPRGDKRDDDDDDDNNDDDNDDDYDDDNDDDDNDDAVQCKQSSGWGAWIDGDFYFECK